MSIDVDELKSRIAKVRSGQVVAAAPRGAIAQVLPKTAGVVAQAGRMRRVYSLPIVGRPIRILAAIWNLPSILANLSRHYSAYSAEISRLDSVIADLRHQVETAEQTAHRAQTLAASLSAQLEAAHQREAASQPPGEPAPILTSLAQRRSKSG